MLPRHHWLVIAALAISCTSELQGNPADAGVDCGNGSLDENEACDDGNDELGDGCLRCAVARCGDGEVFMGTEACDDGNTTDGDGCSAECEFEDCGDGEVQPIEQCEGDDTVTCDTSCGTVGSETCDADRCLFAECIPPAEGCNGIDDDCDQGVDRISCLVDIHRFWSGAKSDHMYTTSTASPGAGYLLETQTFTVYMQHIPGTVPLYQKLSANGQNHMLTFNPDEANALGYTLDRTLGYVRNPNDPQWTIDVGANAKEPLTFCRYYNGSNNDHLVDQASREEALAGFGYTREACFFSAWQPL